MTVYELNRDELSELKQRYYSKTHTNLSYDEIVSIDNLVSDEEIYEVYEDTIFTEDDFFSSSNYEKNKEEEECI